MLRVAVPSLLVRGGSEHHLDPRSTSITNLHKARVLERAQGLWALNDVQAASAEVE